MTPAHVAFGANCGDPAAMYARVAAALAARPEIRWVRASKLVSSVPVGAGAERYLNGCFELDSDLAPRALFEILRAVERDFGRIEKGNWAPRAVDLDLALHGDAVVAEPDFLLPHPRMHFRRFVLAPLAELRPDARHPLLGRTVPDLLARLDEALVARAGPPCVWPAVAATWTGPAVLHGGLVVGGAFAENPALVALTATPPESFSALDPNAPRTPVVDCRGADAAAVARELAFLRQSLAPVEPWPAS